jgi:hypothetical protein
MDSGSVRAGHLSPQGTRHAIPHRLPARECSPTWGRRSPAWRRCKWSSCELSRFDFSAPSTSALCDLCVSLLPSSFRCFQCVTQTCSSAPRTTPLFSCTYRLQICVTHLSSQPYAKHRGYTPLFPALSQPILATSALRSTASIGCREPVRVAQPRSAARFFLHRTRCAVGSHAPAVLTRPTAPAYNASPLMGPLTLRK